MYEINCNRRHEGTIKRVAQTKIPVHAGTGYGPEYLYSREWHHGSAQPTRELCEK